MELRRNGELPRPACNASPSHPVIALEIVGDGLGVGLVDRSPEGVDHLGDLRVPAGGVQERRVHRHVVEAVAAGAVALDLVETGARLELNRLLLRRGRAGRDGGDGGDDGRDGDGAHGSPPQAATRVTAWTRLW